MSIEDDPARANHAHNQKAQRIADKAAAKLSGGKIQAGKDYPRENLEAAQGIASVYELQIREARLNFEASVAEVKVAQEAIKSFYQKDQDAKLKFAADMSLVTDIINDLYMEIDEIVPIPDFSDRFENDGDQHLFVNYLLEDLGSGKSIKLWSDQKGEFTNDVADKLNALNFQETAALVKKQEVLKKALDKRQKLEEQNDVLTERNPRTLERLEWALKNRLFESGLALQKLEHKAAMRSVEVKQAIAIHDPDEFSPSQRQKDAEAVANLARAKAYEAGANDEQAQDVWELYYTEDFYAEEIEQARASPEIHFEDEEKKAAIAQSEKLKEELKLLRQENEIKDQTIKVFVDAAKDRKDKNPFTIVAERKAWVELKPHPKDKIHFQKAKAFLNKMKPSGVIELYVHDVDWKKDYSTHTRRALALRGGVLVAGNKVDVLIGDPRKANEFECTFPCGTKVVLGLQESHVIPLKYTFGTALHHDPRWTREYENDEDLHGVPAGISQQADRTPEELIVHHNTLKANLHKAR